MPVNLNTNTHYPNPTNQNHPVPNKESSCIGRLVRSLDSSATGKMIKGIGWGSIGAISGMTAIATFVGGIALACLAAVTIPAGIGVACLVLAPFTITFSILPLMLSCDSFSKMATNLQEMNQLIQAGY